MYKARKRNRVLRIPDEKIEEYKQMGYTIYDLNGNLLYEVEDDATRIAKLERENGLLRAKVAEYEMILEKMNREEGGDPEPKQQPKGKKTGSESK